MVDRRWPPSGAADCSAAPLKRKTKEGAVSVGPEIVTTKITTTDLLSESATVLNKREITGAALREHCETAIIPIISCHFCITLVF